MFLATKAHIGRNKIFLAVYISLAYIDSTSGLVTWAYDMCGDNKLMEHWTSFRATIGAVLHILALSNSKLSVSVSSAQ